MCPNMYIYIYMYLCSCMYIYIYVICVEKYMYTYIYTYTCTQMCQGLGWRLRLEGLWKAEISGPESGEHTWEVARFVSVTSVLVVIWRLECSSILGMSIFCLRVAIYVSELRNT